MVSFYHQLHCLHNLQHMLIRTVEGIEPTPYAVQHAEHCFDYLRQGVMCAGDTTLEGPDREVLPNESPLRGWNVTHLCKDWSLLQRWMTENAPVVETT